MNRQYFVQSSLGKIAKMLADRYQLMVTFEGTVPKTDGKTITLPAVSEELPEAEQRELLSFVLHESAHVLFTEMELAPEFSQKHGRRGFEMLNALEDARIERLMETEYIGANRYFIESDAHWQEMAAGKPPQDEWVQLCCGLYLKGRGYDIPEGWDEKLADPFQSHIDRAVNAKTTREVAAIVEDILSSYPDNSETEEEEDAGSNVGNPDSQSSGQPSNPREMMADQISQSCNEISENRCQIYRRYTEDSDLIEPVADTTKAKVESIEMMVRPVINGLRSQLITALTAEVRTRWQSHLEDGQIDSARLPDLMSGATSRVFKRRIAGKSKDTAVTLLIDCSSSMGGYAIQLAQSVAMAFTDILAHGNIKCRVVGFGGTSELPDGVSSKEYDTMQSGFSHISLVHFQEVKDFRENYRTAKARFPRLRANGTTPLAPALIREVRKLLDFRTERRIMMVLTDGEPNGDGNLSDAEHRRICRDIVSQAERAGVEMVGLGIGVDVSRIFDDSVTVMKIDELAKTVVRQLSKILIGG